MTRILDYLKAWPQYLIPGHLVSRTVHGLARIESPAIKNRLIDAFGAVFDIDLAEAAEPDPHAYPSFNAFFTRALRPGVRPLPNDPAAVASPVDGVVSQTGDLHGTTLLQAKGVDYDLDALLAGERVDDYRDGAFTTIYLAPHDYHRIHMPVAGRLEHMVHIPGRLFSVNPATARVIPRLFARNERVVCHFSTELGPMAIVLVGAVIVGGVETTWFGPVTPPAGRITTWHRYEGESGPRLGRGDEMGRFNVGSTVILLFGRDAIRWNPELLPGAHLRMGQAIAHPTD